MTPEEHASLNNLLDQGITVFPIGTHSKGAAPVGWPDFTVEKCRDMWSRVNGATMNAAMLLSDTFICFDIDYDKHDHAKHFWKHCSGMFKDLYVEKTPGGWHVYGYAEAPVKHVASTTALNGEQTGLELLAGEHYVLTYPSVFQGKAYKPETVETKNVDGLEIPDPKFQVIPQDIIDAYLNYIEAITGKDPRRVTKRTKSSEGDGEFDLDMEDLTNAVMALDANCGRDIWARTVASALAHTAEEFPDFDDELFQLFDDWSRTCEALYSQNETTKNNTRRVYDSFKGKEGDTLSRRSIFELARQEKFCVKGAYTGKYPLDPIITEEAIFQHINVPQQGMSADDIIDAYFDEDPEETEETKKAPEPQQKVEAPEPSVNDKPDGDNIHYTKGLDKNFLDTLPGLFGKLARGIYNDAPQKFPEFAVASALTIMSGIKAGRLQGSYAGHITPAGLYAGIFAESGAGKNYYNNVIGNVMHKLKEGHRKIDKVTSVQGFTDKLYDISPEYAGLVITSDEYVQKLTIARGDNAASYEKGAVVQQLEAFTACEAVGFGSDSKANQSSKTTRREGVNYPVVSMFGTGVPASLADIITLEALDAGYVNRALCFIAPGGFECKTLEQILGGKSEKEYEYLDDLTTYRDKLLLEQQGDCKDRVAVMRHEPAPAVEGEEEGEEGETVEVAVYKPVTLPYPAGVAEVATLLLEFEKEVAKVVKKGEGQVTGEDYARATLYRRAIEYANRLTILIADGFSEIQPEEIAAAQHIVRCVLQAEAEYLEGVCDDAILVTEDYTKLASKVRLKIAGWVKKKDKRLVDEVYVAQSHIILAVKGSTPKDGYIEEKQRIVRLLQEAVSEGLLLKKNQKAGNGSMTPFYAIPPK